jgi:hypothetical protein
LSRFYSQFFPGFAVKSPPLIHQGGSIGSPVPLPPAKPRKARGRLPQFEEADSGFEPYNPEAFAALLSRVTTPPSPPPQEDYHDDPDQPITDALSNFNAEPISPLIQGWPERDISEELFAQV